MPRYQIYGLSLDSDHRFRTRLMVGTRPTDLAFRVKDQAPVSVEGLLPSYASRLRNEDGDSLSALYRLGSLDVVRFADGAAFYLDRSSISCGRPDPRASAVMEIRLLGSILTYWLERLGIPALHCAAVEVEDRAVGFLSSNHGGKTSLAAAMVARGHRLITDDILPLEERDGRFQGRPSYPQMRMWPAEAARFVDDWENLEVVHPELSKRRVPVAEADFCPESRELAALFVPRRRGPDDLGGGVEIVPIAPAQALMQLVRHSFWPQLVETLGWQPRRMALFARIVEKVTICDLLYPPGFGVLPEVCDAISRCVAGFSQPPSPR